MLHAMNQRQRERQIAGGKKRGSGVKWRQNASFLLGFVLNVCFIGLLSGIGANAQFVCLAQWEPIIFWEH